MDVADMFPSEISNLHENVFQLHQQLRYFTLSEWSEYRTLCGILSHLQKKKGSICWRHAWGMDAAGVAAIHANLRLQSIWNFCTYIKSQALCKRSSRRRGSVLLASAIFWLLSFNLCAFARKTHGCRHWHESGTVGNHVNLQFYQGCGSCGRLRPCGSCKHLSWLVLKLFFLTAQSCIDYWSCE